MREHPGLAGFRVALLLPLASTKRRFSGANRSNIPIIDCARFYRGIRSFRSSQHNAALCAKPFGFGSEPEGCWFESKPEEPFKESSKRPAAGAHWPRPASWLLSSASDASARAARSATGCAARSPLPRCQNSPPDDRNPVRSNRRDPVANTPGRLVRKGFAYLLPRPRGSRRMVGDIQMDDAAAVVRENDEDKQDPEGRRGDGEKVH